MAGDCRGHNDREQRMRQLFTQHTNSSPTGGAGLDADSIIARARRRRLPRQLAVGGASALAVVGLLTVALPAIIGPGGLGGAPMSASTFSESDADQREHDGAPEAAEISNLVCGSPLAASDVDGLEVTLEARPVNGAAGEWRIDADLVMRNTGSTARVIDLHAAVFALKQGGITVGSHEGSFDESLATLAPGDTATYTARFEPLPCSPTDVLRGEFELWITIVVDGENATNAVTISSP
ncbi:MAG TPA: hypothetical protein PK781_01710 [Terrimesophilobacter sp.]|nr:hypothetical protein [Terrimesophilobacter sp.]